MKRSFVRQSCVFLYFKAIFYAGLNKSTYVSDDNNGRYLLLCRFTKEIEK